MCFSEMCADTEEADSCFPCEHSKSVSRESSHREPNLIGTLSVDSVASRTEP